VRDLLDDFKLDLAVDQLSRREATGGGTKIDGDGGRNSHDAT
jgi:hypothetical protein